MKEIAGSITQILCSQFSSEVADRLSYSALQQWRHHLLRITRQFLPTALATAAMGVVLFPCIALFLYQLAEYGW